MTINIDLLFTNEDTKCPVFSNILDISIQNFKTIQDKIKFQIEYILRQNKNNFLDQIYDIFVIKPDNIPETYYNYYYEQSIRRGEISDISKESKKKYIDEIREYANKNIIDTQKRSLNTWYSYLLSPENAHISTFIKYWVFKRMIKLGSYNRIEKKFEKRKKSTTSPFPELNQEALHNVFGAVSEINDPPSFRELYSYEFAKLQDNNERSWENTNGIWMHFHQLSDPRRLVEKLEGKNSGLCIASFGTAKEYLYRGKIEVYFSEDSEGQPVNPRVAIHIVGNDVSEVRGVKPDQNLDEFILPIVKKRLDQLPNGKKYFKRCEHMDKLGKIYNKHINNSVLTKEELVFIYQLEEAIEGFGYNEDGRINVIVSTRNHKKDLSKIFACSDTQISTDNQTAIKKNILCHYGYLNLDFLPELPENLSLPEYVVGDLDFGVHKSIPEKLVFPKKVFGDLNLDLVKELPEGIVLPELVRDSLSIRARSLPKKCVFPKKVDGGLNLPYIKSIPEGLVFPETIEYDLGLSRLKYLTKNCVFPKRIGSSLNLDNLQRIPAGFVFPESIGLDLVLTSLKSLPEDILLPKKIARNIIFSHDIILPKDFPFMDIVDWYVNFNEFDSSFPEIPLPDLILGSIHFKNLKSIPKGYRFPKKIKGCLYVDIRSLPEEIVFPEYIGNSLELCYLETLSEKITFPKYIGGTLALPALTSLPEDIKFPKHIGESLDLCSITHLPKNISLPEYIGNDLELSMLKSIKTLLPLLQNIDIKRSIYLSSNLPESEIELLPKSSNLDFYFV